MRLFPNEHAEQPPRHRSGAGLRCGRRWRKRTPYPCRGLGARAQPVDRFLWHIKPACHPWGGATPRRAPRIARRARRCCRMAGGWLANRAPGRRQCTERDAACRASMPACGRVTRRAAGDGPCQMAKSRVRFIDAVASRRNPAAVTSGCCVLARLRTYPPNSQSAAATEPSISARPAVRTPIESAACGAWMPDLSPCSIGRIRLSFLTHR